MWEPFFAGGGSGGGEDGGTDDTGGSSGLGAGTTVGIVIGVLLLVVLLASIGLLLYIHKTDPLWAPDIKWKSPLEVFRRYILILKENYRFLNEFCLAEYPSTI